MPGDGVIREYWPNMFEACRELFMKTFNSAPWNDSWTRESAGARLREFTDHRRFVGFTLWEGDALAGAVFCHAQTQYKGNEIVIEELFIAPDCQRKGYGTALMDAVEAYAGKHAFWCVTLLTGRAYPSFAFYENRGYRHLEWLAFMHKKII